MGDYQFPISQKANIIVTVLSLDQCLWQGFPQVHWPKRRERGKKRKRIKGGEAQQEQGAITLLIILGEYKLTGIVTGNLIGTDNSNNKFNQKLGIFEIIFQQFLLCILKTMVLDVVYQTKRRQTLCCSKPLQQYYADCDQPHTQEKVSCYVLPCI